MSLDILLHLFESYLYGSQVTVRLREITVRNKCEYWLGVHNGPGPVLGSVPALIHLGSQDPPEVGAFVMIPP